MTRRPLPLVLVFALLIGLTGCDGAAPEPDRTGPAGMQSTTAACAEVSDTVSDAVAALQQVDPADPAAAADAIAAVGARVRVASDTIANAEVGALLPAMDDDLAAISTALEAIAAGDLSRSAALEAPITGLQRSFSQFRELCGGS